MTVVPPQYQALINQASLDSGVPADVVAAQIELESGFNPSARSSAGAEGIAQFLPSTFASYGSGSPFNAADALKAYAAYMKALLKQFNGNLRDALAAYNAGPGNIQAGMGYANKILASAGATNIGNLFAGGGSGDTSQPSDQQIGVQSLGQFGKIVTDIGSSLNPFSGLDAVAHSIGSIVTDFSTALNMISLLFKPAFWLRVGAFVMGVILLIGGTVALTGAMK